jgi:DNA-binding beta-propeller fold protein YncE
MVKRASVVQVSQLALVAVLLSIVVSSCTISVFEDGHDDEHIEGDEHDEADHNGEHTDGDEHTAGDEHDEADHDDEHTDGDEHDEADHNGEHTEGDEHDDSQIDHHGNPIYDENERVYEQVVAEGMSVEFTVENFIGVGGRGGETAPRIVEGEHATLQFRITDAATGEPIGGLRPAVWLDAARTDDECSSRVEGYVSGRLERRPIIDLNSYFILAMNRENTISVIDPLIDVGGMTNLFSLILLQSTPQDWAMSGDSSRLFVTLPEIDRVAVVDLNAFLVEDSLVVPGQPVRIASEPGGRHMWVTLGDGGGIAVIDVVTLTVDTIATDSAAHALAFSDDGTRAVVGTTNGALILDVATHTQIGRVELRGTPVAVSAANGNAYLAQPGPGLVSVVDLDAATEVARLTTGAGVIDVGTSLDGRWGVAVSPDADTAYVLDTTTNRVTHVFPVAGAPNQVMFTGTTAYIRTDASPSITAVPLDDIDPTGDISVMTVPIGSAPPGSVGAPVVAHAIAPTPDGGALLIANPAEDIVHFYTEGSEATLGGFQGHTLQPRAVQIVDRSLKEPTPGVYTGSIRIPQGGDFVVAFLLNDPTVVNCFSFSAHDAEDSLTEADEVTARIELAPDQALAAGRSSELEFVVREAGSDDLIEGVEDVVVMLVHAGGSWSSRVLASPQPEGGYVAEFAPPDAGTYASLFAIPSLGMTFQSIPPISVQVSRP